MKEINSWSFALAHRKYLNQDTISPVFTNPFILMEFFLKFEKNPEDPKCYVDIFCCMDHPSDEIKQYVLEIDPDMIDFIDKPGEI